MFNVDDKVKLNEELCPEANRTNKKFQFGKLNYFALFLDFEFEIERLFTDDFHGEMMECKVIDNDKVKSNIVLLVKDVVLASKTMVKMDFEIVSRVNKFQTQIDELKRTEAKELEFRKAEKSKGGAITSRKLIDNWKEIQSARTKIKKLEESDEKVYRIKHKLGIFELDCKEDQIPSKLRALIRSNRKDGRSLKVETKSAGGGLNYEKIGGVLTKPAKFLEINEKYAVNIIKEHKAPKTPDNYVGIEIEMLSPKSIEAMNKEFVKARLHRIANIGTDGSIRVDTGGFNPMELRLCIPERDIETVLKQVCEVLRKNDCYANRSCGMHVHIDMRNRDPELCYKNFFKVQNIMLNVQPVSRRSNQYCMPNTKETVKLKDFDGCGGDDTRRRVINTQAYNKKSDGKVANRTIEIRVHEGATKYKAIINWVKFLVATASLKTELPKVINDTKELRAAQYLDESIVANLDERIEEYSA